MDKWAELKIKTDISAFENELKRFAKQYHEANLLEVHISEWQKGISDSRLIDLTGNPIDNRGEGRNYAISFERQIPDKPWLATSDPEVTFYVSRIGGDYPLLLFIPLGIVDSYPFVSSFLSRCRELWDVIPVASPVTGKNDSRQSEPIDGKSTVTPTDNMPQQDLKQVTNNYYGDYVAGDKIGGDKVGGDKTTVGNISDSTGIAVGTGASANKGVDPQDKEASTK